jgi:hypothetical protein
MASRDPTGSGRYPRFLRGVRALRALRALPWTVHLGIPPTRGGPTEPGGWGMTGYWDRWTEDLSIGPEVQHGR